MEFIFFVTPCGGPIISVGLCIFVLNAEQTIASSRRMFSRLVVQAANFFACPLLASQLFKSIRENYLLADYAARSLGLHSENTAVKLHHPPIVEIGSNDDAGASVTTRQSIVFQSPSSRSVSPGTCNHTPIIA
jgi:hypothetical protein